jgi:hypothetical protein
VSASTVAPAVPTTTAPTAPTEAAPGAVVLTGAEGDDDGGHRPIVILGVIGVAALVCLVADRLARGGF